MIVPFEPCKEFDRIFEPHFQQCAQCQTALKKMQEVEWHPDTPFFCKQGIDIFNAHLNQCQTCTTGTSAYLQQLAEALTELDDKPTQ